MTDPENTNGDYPPLATTLEREKDQRLIETCTVIVLLHYRSIGYIN